MWDHVPFLLLFLCLTLFCFFLILLNNNYPFFPFSPPLFLLITDKPALREFSPYTCLYYKSDGRVMFWPRPLAFELIQRLTISSGFNWRLPRSHRDRSESYLIGCVVSNISQVTNYTIFPKMPKKKKKNYIWNIILVSIATLKF